MSDGSDNGADTFPNNGGSDPAHSGGGGVSPPESGTPPSTPAGHDDGSAGTGGASVLKALPIEIDLGGKSFVDVTAGGEGGLNLGADANVGSGLTLDLGGKGDALTGLVGVGGLDHLGTLVGDQGSLIDLDFGQGDGHTAALLDVVVGGEDIAKASLLGSEILGGGDGIGACGLLDGLFDDCSLLS